MDEFQDVNTPQYTLVHLLKPPELLEQVGGRLAQQGASAGGCPSFWEAAASAALPRRPRRRTASHRSHAAFPPHPTHPRQNASKPPDQRHSLFVVGDPDQAVYGFRGADMTTITTQLPDDFSALQARWHAACVDVAVCSSEKERESETESSASC